MRPVVLDQPRFDLRLPALHADRASGQAILVGVLGMAFAAILLARPSEGGGGLQGPAGALVSPEPGSSQPTELGATPTATEAAASAAATQTEPSASPEPTAPAPSSESTPRPSPAATPKPSASPSKPTASGATYRVKSGDTLSAIAARFGTTTQVLVRLNGIENPGKLKVGQVIKLP
jgi:LysM repeat protein